MNNLLVIIVTYNGMKWLDKCLTSIYNSIVKADVMVIDNGSSDGSFDYIKNNYQDVILIKSEENLGFGGANNIGINYAITKGYQYVYLLNQDAWVGKNTFNNLLNFARSNQDYWVLSPLQVNRNEDKLDSNFAKCCPDALLSDSILGQELSDVYEVSFVMAAHWLISLECLKTVGAFSPSFHHYGEDNNYIDRIHYFKKKVGIVPSCIGVHDRENRSSSISKAQYLFYVDNLIILSNPNIKKKILRFLGKYLIVGLKCKSRINFKYFFKVIKSLHVIRKNYKRSKKPGAFLNLSNK